MKNTNKALLTALVLLVDVLAVASIVLLPKGDMFDRPLTLLALLALALGVGTRSIMLPRLGLKVVAADAFVLCALLTLAPAAVPLVALASTIGVAFSKGSRFFSVQTAFNCGAVPTSFSVATGVYIALGGGSGQPVPAILPLLAAAVTHALINVPLTATAVSIATGRSWFDLFRKPLGMAIVSNVTCALLGTGLMLAWVAAGPLALAIGLLPLLPIEEYIRMHARRDGAQDGTAKPAAPQAPQTPQTMQTEGEEPPERIARGMT